MKNTIIALIIIILVAIGAYAFMSREGSIRNETDVEEANQGSGEEMTVRGTVAMVNTEQIAADGPALVTVALDGGGQAIIGIRSMGINLCAAQPNIMNVQELKIGDRVEARGAEDVEGIIVPCESAEHFLRRAAQ